MRTTHLAAPFLSGPADAAVRLALIPPALRTCVPAPTRTRMDLHSWESARKALYDRDSFRSLLKTARASQGERAAAQVLTAAIGNCLSGGDISLDVPMITAMVAPDSFRLAAAKSARQEAGDLQ